MRVGGALVCFSRSLWCRLYSFALGGCTCIVQRIDASCQESGRGAPFGDGGDRLRFGRSPWSYQGYSHLLIGSPQGLVSLQRGLLLLEGFFVFKMFLYLSLFIFAW